MNLWNLFLVAQIIIHNACFDIGFINSELSRCNMKKLDENDNN